MQQRLSLNRRAADPAAVLVLMQGDAVETAPLRLVDGPARRDLPRLGAAVDFDQRRAETRLGLCRERDRQGRSEEHTSELQSPVHLVCRPPLEKKKPSYQKPNTDTRDALSTADS